MPQHRRPPLPFFHTPAGSCRWCGEATDTPRKRWHAECVTLYNIAVSSQSQRAACFERDRGVCCDCGVNATAMRCEAIHWRSLAHDLPAYGWHRTGMPEGPVSRVEFRAVGWEADHDVPLYSLPKPLTWPDDLIYFSVTNLRTRCIPCHDKKSAREAAERAKVERMREKHTRYSKLANPVPRFK